MLGSEGLPPPFEPMLLSSFWHSLFSEECNTHHLCEKALSAFLPCAANVSLIKASPEGHFFFVIRCFSLVLHMDSVLGSSMTLLLSVLPNPCGTQSDPSAICSQSWPWQIGVPGGCCFALFSFICSLCLMLLQVLKRQYGM